MNSPIMYFDPDGRSGNWWDNVWKDAKENGITTYSNFDSSGNWGNSTFSPFAQQGTATAFYNFLAGGGTGNFRYWTGGAETGYVTPKGGSGSADLVMHQINIKENKKKTAKEKRDELIKNLHTGFDAVEELGGYMEISGLLLIPYTEGASVALTAVGANVVKIGLAGNIVLDAIEGNGKMILYRGIKYGITAGTGKVIDRFAPGFLDNVILQSKLFIYDKLVSPGIQQNYVPGMPPKPQTKKYGFHIIESSRTSKYVIIMRSFIFNSWIYIIAI